MVVNQLVFIYIIHQLMNKLDINLNTDDISDAIAQPRLQRICEEGEK